MLEQDTWHTLRDMETKVEKALEAWESSLKIAEQQRDSDVAARSDRYFQAANERVNYIRGKLEAGTGFLRGIRRMIEE